MHHLHRPLLPILVLGLLSCEGGDGIAEPGDPPVAPSLTVDVQKNHAVEVEVQALNPRGVTLTYQVLSGPSHGTLELTPLGDDVVLARYTPDAGFAGEDVIAYRVSDGERTDDGEITLRVLNTPPEVEGTGARRPLEEGVTLQVVGRDADGDALEFRVVTAPGNGTLGPFEVSGAPAGAGPAAAHAATVIVEVRYEPDPGFTGADAFEVEVFDGHDASPAALLEITVNAPPALDAEDGRITVETWRAAPVDVEILASDPDGDPLTFELVAGPANGAVEGLESGGPGGAVATYTPDPDFAGTDLFTFRISDGLDAVEGEVEVVVVNRPPVAQAVTTERRIGEAVTIELAGSDPDGDALTFEVVEGPDAGTLGPLSPGGANRAFVEYTPDPDADGPDRFRYVVSDGLAESAPALVEIGIENTPPAAHDQTVTIGKNRPEVITLTGSDADGDALGFAIESAPANGALGPVGPVDGSSATVQYIPDADFEGTDSFTFTVSDDGGGSEPATVTLIVVNEPPTAETPATAAVVTGAQVTVPLTGSDPNGDALTFQVHTPPDPPLGTVVSVTSTGPTSADLVFEAGSTSGQVTFQIVANDGGSDSAPAVVTVDIVDANAEPEADAQSVEVDEDGSLLITLTGSDADGDPLTFAIVTPPDHGDLTGLTQVPPTSATVTYTPTSPGPQADAFTFSVSDGETDPVTAVVSIQIRDVPEDQALDAVANTQLRSDGFAAPTTPHVTVAGPLVGATLTLAPASVGTAATDQGGEVTLDADGHFLYSPPPGHTGDDTFEFEVTSGRTASVTVTLTDPIWWVDDRASGGTGLSHDPHETLAAALADSGAGDRIFIWNGTGAAHSGGAALKTDQLLLGEPAGVSVPGFGALVAPDAGATRPSIVNAAGNGIDLAAGAQVHAVNVTSASGAGIRADGLSGEGASVTDVDVSGTGGPGVSMTSTTTTVALTDVVVTSTNQVGIHSAGSATGTLTFDGGSVTTGGRAALDLQATTLAGTLGAATSTNSTGEGIVLDVVSGSLEISGGSIQGAAGVAFHADGGSATLRYDGTVTNGAGRSVSVTSRTGGSVTLGGDVSDTGTGILLDDNGGSAVAFEGNLSLSTGASAAFTATGGGTVTATGTGSTLSTTTGTALRVESTTIGAAGLAFQSISSAGAASGIVLNDTGTSGGLTVTGTGAAGSGGTIASSTGPGILLSSTRDVSLARVIVQNGGDDGIRGTGVTNFSLANSTVSGNGNAVGEHGVDFTNLLGTASITSSTVSGSADDNLRVENTGGTLSMLMVGGAGCTFSNTSTSTGNDGILFLGDGTANMSITVDGCTFANNRGDHFQISTSGSNTAVMDATFTNNTLTGDGGVTASPAGTDLGAGVTVSAGGASQVTVDISDNTVVGAVVSAVTIFQSATSTAAATLDAIVQGNTIGAPGETDSGSTQGHGISVVRSGTGTLTTDVSDNVIRQYANAHGIHLATGDGTGTLNATVTGNVVAEPGSFGANGVHLNSGLVASDAGLTCLVLGGAGALANSLVGSGGAFDDDFRLRQRQSTTVRLPGYAGAADDTGAVVAFVQGINAGTPSGSAAVTVAGGGFVGGSACPLP